MIELDVKVREQGNFPPYLPDGSPNPDQYRSRSWQRHVVVEVEAETGDKAVEKFEHKLNRIMQ
jgi:hypothetical protein